MKKMDEMEMSISSQAIKFAWAYTIIFLFIWMIYDWINTKTLGLPFFLLISQNLIFLGIQQYLKWKFGKYEE